MKREAVGEELPMKGAFTSHHHEENDGFSSQDFVIETLKRSNENAGDIVEGDAMQEKKQRISVASSKTSATTSFKSPLLLLMRHSRSSCSSGSCSDDEHDKRSNRKDIPRRQPRRRRQSSTSHEHHNRNASSRDTAAAPSSAHNSTAAASRSTSYFSAGDDFYDDDYSQASSVASISEKLDFQGAMQHCRLESREAALQQLVTLYENIYQESVTLQEQEQQQHYEEEQRRKTKQGQHDAVLLQQQQQHDVPESNYTTSEVTTDTQTTTTSTMVPDATKRNKTCETTKQQSNGSLSSGISKSMAIVRGKSGTGKSTLVQQFFQALNGDVSRHTSSGASQPYFLSGKYTQENGGQPLSAIVQAFEDFLQQILRDEVDRERQRLKLLIQELVMDDNANDKGNDHNILLSLLPSLRALLYEDTRPLLKNVPKQVSSQEFTTETSFDVDESVLPKQHSGRKPIPPSQDDTNTNSFPWNQNDNALNQLTYIFSVFCKAIATKERPLVLFLDDLQWSDPPSRKVFQTLLTDPSLKFVMFVGAVRHDVEMTEQRSDFDDNDSALTPLSPSVGVATGTSGTGSAENAAAAMETIEWLSQLESKSVGITIGNFSLDELTQFVAATLKLHHGGGGDGAEQHDPEDDLLQRLRGELVQVIYDKTRGNIFFSKQILEQLYRVGLLEFSRMTFQWEWHLQDANLDDLLSSNVLHAVTTKLKALSPLLQQALIVAAYTKATFDVDTLLFLLHFCALTALGEELPHLEGLVKLLDYAVLEGLLSNSTGSKNYSFDHDRIQQAALGMIQKGQQRDVFRLAIGQGLYELATGMRVGISKDSIVDVLATVPADKEWMLFVAADHMNASSLMYQLQREMAPSQTTIDPLTALNCHLGCLAASKAAYEPASIYLMLAKQYLLRSCREPWNSQYDLTLKIFSKLVDVELWRGNYRTAQSIAKHLLINARKAEDRLPTQLALAKAYGREEKHAESLQNAVSALRALKLYPKGPVCKYAGLMKNLLFLKRYFNRKRDEEIVSLPLMTDKRYLMAMEFMSVGSYQAYYLGNEIEFVILALRMLDMTIKHGLCGQSGVALIAYALICNNLNDMEGAHRFSALSRLVLERTRAKHLEPIQLLVVAHWITGWSDPHPNVLSVFERGYRSGMETGDFENALLNMTAGYHHEYAAGYLLPVLDMKYEQLVQRLRLHMIKSVLVMSEEQWRKIKHLMGKNASGHPLDVTELSKFGSGKKTDGSEKYGLLYGYLCRLELAVYFGDLDFAAEMAVKTFENDSDNAFTTNSLRLYFSGLTYATLARNTGRRLYRRKAKSCYREFKKLCDIKGLNSWHRVMVLEAQWKTLEGKEDSRVEATYDRAVQCALSSGHIQDAALASQLAADYFSSLPIHTRNDRHAGDSMEFGKSSRTLITKYRDQARQFYFQWGAYRLVRHLEEKYGVDPFSKYICDATSNITQSFVPSNRASDVEIPGASRSVVSVLKCSGENGADGVDNLVLHHPGRSGGLPAISASHRSESRSSSFLQHRSSDGRSHFVLEDHDNISVMTDLWKDNEHIKE